MASCEPTTFALVAFSMVTFLSALFPFALMVDSSRYSSRASLARHAQAAVPPSKRTAQGRYSARDARWPRMVPKTRGPGSPVCSIALWRLALRRICLHDHNYMSENHAHENRVCAGNFD